MATRLTPIARVEHEDRIIKLCPIIHPTGCTPQFCQSGQLDRPLEQHVGENRPLSVIKSEAKAFLQEMYDEGLFENQKTFKRRLEKVMEEISTGVVETKVWVDQQEVVGGVANVERVEVEGQSSRGWIQTSKKLEWGVRVSWRNSRMCILRAHYHDLK
jgi:nitric oxide synthase oxygenase domain/subunit